MRVWKEQSVWNWKSKCEAKLKGGRTSRILVARSSGAEAEAKVSGQTTTTTMTNQVSLRKQSSKHGCSICALSLSLSLSTPMLSVRKLCPLTANSALYFSYPVSLVWPTVCEHYQSTSSSSSQLFRHDSVVYENSQLSWKRVARSHYKEISQISTNESAC